MLIFKLDKKLKKETRNLKNYDGICFQQVALNREDIERHQERVLNIKLFIYNNSWEGIKYLSGKDNW